MTIGPRGRAAAGWFAPTPALLQQALWQAHSGPAEAELNRVARAHRAGARAHAGANAAASFDASKYVTVGSDGSYSFDTGGALGASGGAAVNALANSSVLPAPLASDISQALQIMGTIAVAAGATAAESLGLSLVAMAVFSAFYAATLIPGVGAASGPGNQCCSSGGRYGSCGADMFSWEAMWGTPPSSPAGSFEANANAAIVMAYNQVSDCSHALDPSAFAAGMIPFLVAAWNKTHTSEGQATVRPIPGDAMGHYTVPGSGGTRTIRALCNVNPNPGSSSGFQCGEPGGSDPISVGLNYIAQVLNCPAYPNDPFSCPSGCASPGFPVGGQMTITVNNGPPIADMSELNNVPPGASLISSHPGGHAIWKMPVGISFGDQSSGPSLAPVLSVAGGLVGALFWANPVLGMVGLGLSALFEAFEGK